MNYFNLSEQCENDWKKTLDAPLYLKGVDEELSDLVVKFLSQDYSDVSTNPIKQKEIKRMVDKFASVFGVRISRIMIVSDPNSSVLGGYIDKDKSVALNATPENLSAFNKMTFLNTIVHELRHAQQHQIFRHLSDSPEFSSIIDENFKHYQRPAGKIVQNARYFSNFIEVDAELFSYAFSEGLLEQVKSNPRYANFSSQILTSINQNKTNKSEFEQNFETSRQVLELNNQAFLTLKQAVTEFKTQVFSENPPQKEQIDLMTESIMTMANALINDQASQFIDFNNGKVQTLINALYKGANPFEIANHLDNPVVSLIEKLDKKYCYGLGSYGHEQIKLKDLTQKCQYFLKKYNIPFNPNKPSEILRKAKQIMPEVFLAHVKKHDESESLKQDMHLLFDMDCHLGEKNRWNELYEQCTQHVVETIPREELKKLLEEISTIDDKHLGYSHLTRYALDGYVTYYTAEHTFHTIEKFLQVAGVRYKKGNFSDMFDKYEEAMPRFLIKCLLKSNLTKEEADVIKLYNLGGHKDVEPQALVDALHGTFMSKSRLEKALKNPDEKNAVIEALEKRGINVQELLASLSKSKNNS